MVNYRQDYRDFRMHRTRRARKKKKECVRESANVQERKGEITMNDMIRGRVCATKHVKFHGMSIVRSRYEQIHCRF